MYKLPSLFDGKSFMGLYKFISSFMFGVVALDLIYKPITALPCYPVFYCPVLVTFSVLPAVCMRFPFTICQGHAFATF